MSKKHRSTRIKLVLKVVTAGSAFAVLMTAMLAYQVASSTSESLPDRRAVTAQAAGVSSRSTTPKKPQVHRTPQRHHRATETLAAYSEAERRSQAAEAARLAARRGKRRKAARAEDRRREPEASGPPVPVPAPAPITSEPS